MLGMLVSLLAFFPGWMSVDSLTQYMDAKSDVYHDWHPVLMAWWWRILDGVYPGPALMLVQNLLLYWLGFGLLAIASSRWIGVYAGLLPLVGFWPGILFPLGEIWKDICFATSIFFAWALLINVYSQQRTLYFIETTGIFILSIFAVGVKPNGLVVLPFLMWFWTSLERWCRTGVIKRILLTVVLTLTFVLVSIAIVPKEKIVKQYNFQYSQVYDLLAITVKSNRNVFPEYIRSKMGDAKEFGKLYSPGANTAFSAVFLGLAPTSPGLATTKPLELADLQRCWIDAISSHPFVYLQHRLNTFAALLRLDSARPAGAVAWAGIVSNPFGFTFTKNILSKALTATLLIPFMYAPWVYLLALLASVYVLARQKRHKTLLFCFSGSSIAFALPHIFVVPSNEYRYLYYSNLCAVTLTFFGAVAVLRPTIERRPLRNRPQCNKEQAPIVHDNDSPVGSKTTSGRSLRRCLGQ